MERSVGDYMSAKKILTVGFNLASEDTQHATLETKISLLDWDIILIKPTITSSTLMVTNFSKENEDLMRALHSA